MDRPGDLAQWNISKIMTVCCQITCAIPWLPCEQLPYSPEYPRISRMRQEISQICPCPFCPINTYFSGTPSPSCHSTAQNPLSRRRHHPRFPRTSTKASFTNPPSLRPSSLRENGHQLHRAWGQFTTLLFRTSTVLLFIRDFFHSILLFLFVLLFILKNF